ncbi:MAG: asparagine synthase (glutamine-hydrolyzing) [Thermodesulfobacteriota bacterium]
MCGIAGIVGPGAHAGLCRDMVAAIGHRGPDARGDFFDGTAALGQARLSIIDLSTGDQPMANEDGTVWIVYNGEIYNYKELREDLVARGHRFATESDTEVLIHGYEEWGVNFLPKPDGIYAFAIWDQPRKRLVLARDYFGVKPLHYQTSGSTIRFGSEIKAVLADPSVPRSVDLQALHAFLNLRYIPGERTLVAGVKRLLPGHALVFENGRATTTRFFRLPPPRPEKRSEEECLEGIRHYLRRAVVKQLVADVPVGVYLSGGMDSSTLVAFMAEAGVNPIRTFSLGFNEPTDELSDARIVAERFGTEHHETTLSADPLQSFPKVTWFAEEPKENILQGYLLAGFARRSVKVVQGGLGGDEIFAGYAIDNFLYPARNIHRLVPGALSRGLLAPLSRLLYSAQAKTGAIAADEYRRGLQLLCAAGDPRRFYLILRNVWDHDTGAFSRFYGPVLQKAALAPVEDAFAPFFTPEAGDGLSQALWAEFHTKMVDDFLENEDRTSMANGLEVRVPFLDRDLVSFAMTIPPALLMKGNSTKYLFRKAMGGILPEHTLRKKKWGFTFNPYYQFQKDLKSTAERILTKKRVEERGWFNYGFLRKILDHPPHPRLRWHYFFLWLAMGLEIWAGQFLEGDMKNPKLALEDFTC